MKRIRNSIISAAGAALLAAALLATSPLALQVAADDDSVPSPAEVSPVGIDSSGQFLTRQPDDTPVSSGDSVPGYKPDSIESTSSNIIGEGERVRPADTTVYPSSAIVYISKGGRLYYTGWTIPADTLVTAGYYVYSHERQGRTSGLEFSPGVNGLERPSETATATQKWTDVAWVKNNGPRLDWGLVKLDKPLGDRTDWFGPTRRSEDYKDIGVELRGYPYDKAPEELWGMGGAVTENRGNQLCYLMDTFPAQSGSPLYMSDGAFAIGIHAYGTVRGQQQPGREYPQEYNAGTRIIRGLYELSVDLKSR